MRDFAQNPIEKHTVAYPVSIYVPGQTNTHKYPSHVHIYFSRRQEEILLNLNTTLEATFNNQWGTTDIQSCPIKITPLFRAPAVWVVPV